MPGEDIAKPKIEKSKDRQAQAQPAAIIIAVIVLVRFLPAALLPRHPGPRHFR